MSKILADSIVIVIARRGRGWSGEIVVNGDAASGCSAPSAEGVLDAVWAGAFYDEVGSESLYTTRAGTSEVEN